MSICTANKRDIYNLIADCFADFQKGNDVEHYFDEYNLYDRGFEYDRGASKYCILHPEFNGYVVKFCNGGYFDHCEREYSNYIAAVARGFGDYFVYTEYLGEVNGIRFYIQEEAIVDSDRISDIWFYSLREDYEPEDEEDDEDIINERVWDAVGDLEDEERCSMCFPDMSDEFACFLDEYCINDLHEGNFGYIGGNIVIIDFSGYGWRAQERDF